METEHHSLLWVGSRYRVLRTLGTGGLGSVFQGWDQELNRPVAIKRLLSDPAGPGGPARLSEAWQEARTLAALPNPHILTLYDFGSDEEGAYFIMEYLEGETLEEVLQRGPLPLAEVWEMGRQVLEGLAAAHGKSIRHLDLKPSNLMLQRTAGGNLHVKILDFGLARFQQQIDAATASGSPGGIFGTVFYISPEHLERGVLGGYTDLYALGHVLYQCLRGRTAYTGMTMDEVVLQHLHSEPEPIREFRPDVSPAQAAWLHRLMSHRPQDRPPEAAAALAEWQNLEIMAAASHRPVFLPGSPGPTGKWKRGMGWVVALVLVLVLLVIFFFWTRSPAGKKMGSSPTAARASNRAVVPGSSSMESPLVFTPEDLAALREQVGQQVVVRGIPRLVGKNRDDSVRYLNFSDDYTRTLSLVFFVEDGGEEFSVERLQAWVGRPVEVRGRVQEYRNTLQIRIRNPTQLRDTVP